MKKYKKIYLILFLSVLLDQIIKILVSYNMNSGESINIINNFFSITYAKNIGAAWSMFSGARMILILLGIVAINVIFFFFIFNKELNKKEQFLYSILMGGILGNIIDRVVYGYVIDYLDFKIFGYNYPIFNVADIFIVVSIILIIIFSFKGKKNEISSK